MAKHKIKIKEINEENLSNDWDALLDAADLFKCERLSNDIPTDRLDDSDDYVALFGADVLKDRPFLNIGAGDWRHPVWQNHDFVQPPYHNYTLPEFNIDLSLMETWPIKDQSFFGAFTSHTIEHLTTDIAMHVFREAARILKKGGIFRLTCPDLYTAHAAWRLQDMRYYNERSGGRVKNEESKIVSTRGFSKGKPVYQLYFERVASCYGGIKQWNGEPLDRSLVRMHEGRTPEQAADIMLSKADFQKKKPYQHINYWTEEKLRNALIGAGFRLVIRNSYSQCIFPLMRNKAYFDRTRPNESIWVDAVK